MSSRRVSRSSTCLRLPRGCGSRWGGRGRGRGRGDCDARVDHDDARRSFTHRSSHSDLSESVTRRGVEIGIQTEVHERFPAPDSFGFGFRDDGQRGLRRIDAPHVEDGSRRRRRRAGRRCGQLDGGRTRETATEFAREEFFKEPSHFCAPDDTIPARCATACRRRPRNVESGDSAVLSRHP
ncbi:hypothetical protein BCEP4_130023 [Burkholderia cepacia]|nr:hypothetical protein BCEP4_130023 [Burkholderia cepacia]